jgi:hypothetical protein
LGLPAATLCGAAAAPAAPLKVFCIVHTLLQGQLAALLPGAASPALRWAVRQQEHLHQAGCERVAAGAHMLPGHIL